MNVNMNAKKRVNGSWVDAPYYIHKTAADTFTTLPADIKADGSPITVWSMKGNGQQTGTPTPDNPVMPDFCGVRTGNLFDKKSSNIINNRYLQYNGELDASSNHIVSDFMPINGAYVTISNTGVDNTISHCFYDSNKTCISSFRLPTIPRTIEIPSNAKFIRCTVPKLRINDFMLNLGSTALPYEPYGYKIPLTNAGQTVPVYLGQTQTVRKIRKLVLTGEENITMPSTSSFQILGVIQWGSANGFCTHYQQITWDEVTYVTADGFAIRASSGGADRFRICDRSITTIADFRSYLSQQYAAGTPVTVWYVLATPENGIVNEPLAKIGDYADEMHSTDAGVTIPTVKGDNTLTIDTDLPPSELSLTYTGWHPSVVHERINGAWVDKS